MPLPTGPQSYPSGDPSRSSHTSVSLHPLDLSRGQLRHVAYAKFRLAIPPAKRGAGEKRVEQVGRKPLLFLLEITSRVDYRLINSKRVSIIVDKSIWILAREVSLGELWERIELLGSGRNERSVRPPFNTPFNHTREYAQVEMDGSGCKRNRPTIDAKSETRLWTMAVE